MNMKTVIFSSLLLVYTLLWGGILEVCRRCVYFYFSVDQYPLPPIPEFFLKTCYSTNGFSAYSTYIEIMLIPFMISLFICLLNKKLSRFNISVPTQEILLYCYCIETLLGMFFLLVFILPLSGRFSPEVLNPPNMQTSIALYIHYSFIVFAIVLLVTALLQEIKKR